MRLILGISLLLFGALRLSCDWDVRARADGAQGTRGQWVRTVDGWERTDAWLVRAPEPVKLNPLVVAAGQGLLSVLALATFQPGELVRRRDR